MVKVKFSFLKYINILFYGIALVLMFGVNTGGGFYNLSTVMSKWVGWCTYSLASICAIALCIVCHSRQWRVASILSLLFYLPSLFYVSEIYKNFL